MGAGFVQWLGPFQPQLVSLPDLVDQIRHAAVDPVTAGIGHAGVESLIEQVGQRNPRDAFGLALVHHAHLAAGAPVGDHGRHVESGRRYE